VSLITLIYTILCLPGPYIWKIREFHEKYGPIIRINHHEIHVYDPEFYHTLYAGGAQKRNRDPWHAASLLDFPIICKVLYALLTFIVMPPWKWQPPPQQKDEQAPHRRRHNCRRCRKPQCSLGTNSHLLPPPLFTSPTPQAEDWAPGREIKWSFSPWAVWKITLFDGGG